MCRERFLLTSEAALKTHLTEFHDHQLLATRCGLLLCGGAMVMSLSVCGG